MEKLKEIEKIKNEIIVHCLDYSDTKQDEYKQMAIDKLKPFSEFYSVPLNKKIVNISFGIAFREFILNKKGYNRTIINLYNCHSK